MEKRKLLVWFVVGVLFIPFIVLGVLKKEHIDKNGYSGVCKIVDFYIGPKGTTTRKKEVKVEYYYLNKRYDKYFPSHSNTKIGDCFSIKFMEENPEDAVADFTKPLPCW